MHGRSIRVVTVPRSFSTRHCSESSPLPPPMVILKLQHMLLYTFSAGHGKALMKYMSIHVLNLEHAHF